MEEGKGIVIEGWESEEKSDYAFRREMQKGQKGLNKEQREEKQAASAKLVNKMVEGIKQAGGKVPEWYELTPAKQTAVQETQHNRIKELLSKQSSAKVGR